MKITILGSGGFTTTPYVNCQCNECNIARTDIDKARTGPSFYIHDLDLLIDTSKDAPKQIDKLGFFPKNICFSHWHPDHTEGWRVLECFNNKPNVFIQRNSNILEKVPGLKYLSESGVIDIIDWDINSPIVNLGTQLSYNLLDKNTPVYSFNLVHSGVNALITPDHSKYLLHSNFKMNLDLLIMNLGIDKVTGESTTFSDNLKIIEKLKPAKTVLTHIEAHALLTDTTSNIQLAYDNLVLKI
jgi:phosphoribosyl 1,2-cyclic phosphate phosphodiesterase